MADLMIRSKPEALGFEVPGAAIMVAPVIVRVGSRSRRMQYTDPDPKRRKVIQKKGIRGQYSAEQQQELEEILKLRRIEGTPGGNPEVFGPVSDAREAVHVA